MPKKLTMLARAKINLSLHVKGRRRDGYHLLGGIVAFADIGDELHISLADADKSSNVAAYAGIESGGGEGEMKGERNAGWSLSLKGAFAPALATGADNLVLAAARKYCAARSQACAGKIELVKNLPVASGMGGGSADAAAMLKGLDALCENGSGKPSIFDMALALGADVPMCLESRAGSVAGIGERFSPLPDFEPLCAVLVNPGQAVSTGEVFAALDAPVFTGDLKQAQRPLALPPFMHKSELITWLRGQGNDLEKPARRLAPVIGRVLDELSAGKGCLLARMSGSGASCFGLYEDAESSRRAALELASTNPGWWVRAALLS